MTTTKKTATKTFADAIEHADRQALIKAADAREAFAELKDSILRYEEEFDDASARVRWMQANFARGVDAVSVEEYSTALARVERAKFLANRHRVDRDGVVVEDKRVELAEKRLPASEKRLASVVADALTDALPGVQILTTFGKVTGEPTEADLPVAVVSQSLPTQDDVHGGPGKGLSVTSGLFISGEVTISLYRKPEHRELYPPKISRHLARQGVSLLYADSLSNGETSSVARGAYELDTLSLTVRSADNPSASPRMRELYEQRVSKTTLGSGPENAMDVFVSVGH
ncbi:hypothetical protein ACWEQ1_26035 [Streptomyces nodosus]